jgi:hypothetical protein
MLFSRMPSKVVAVYEFSELKEITKMNDPEFLGLRSMNPFILAAMQEDGRLAGDEDFLDQ